MKSGAFILIVLRCYSNCSSKGGVDQEFAASTGLTWESGVSIVADGGSGVKALSVAG